MRAVGDPQLNRGAVWYDVGTMAVLLNDKTQKLIEEGMRETGIATADELVQLALRTLHQSRGEDFEALDPETKAAIERGLAEADRGEGRPWEQVRDELRARFVK